MIGLAATPAARADVVPPRAVEVADGWFALLDEGRAGEALRLYLDDSARRDARRLLDRLSHPPVRIATRAMRSWAGHGRGDTSAMEPGGYFAMVFDTVDASGREGSEEIRMVPHGDDWRVVDDLYAP